MSKSTEISLPNSKWDKASLGLAHVNLLKFDFTPVDILAEVRELKQNDLIDKPKDDSNEFYQITLTSTGKLLRELLMLEKIDSAETMPYFRFMTYKVPPTEPEQEEVWL